VVETFERHEHSITSSVHELPSNEVLKAIQVDLLAQGFQVETSKKNAEKIRVPVLFGRNGKLEKYFEADAFHADGHTVVEVEAGRAVVNYQFLKDLFEAWMMHEVDYLVIAVRNLYKGNSDFNRVATFFDTMYVSRRLILPLKGIMVIGY
jgi:hypothetical protein